MGQVRQLLAGYMCLRAREIPCTVFESVPNLPPDATSCRDLWWCDFTTNEVVLVIVQETLGLMGQTHLILQRQSACGRCPPAFPQHPSSKLDPSLQPPSADMISLSPHCYALDMFHHCSFRLKPWHGLQHFSS